MWRLQELDLLTVIHPALVWDAWLSDKFGLALIIRPGWIGKSGNGQPRINRDLFYILWFLRLSLIRFERMRPV